MEPSWPQGQGRGAIEALAWVGELGGAGLCGSIESPPTRLYVQLCRPVVARARACFPQGSESSHLYDGCALGGTLPGRGWGDLLFSPHI